jgi:two-component system OmpR family response regulator
VLAAGELQLDPAARRVWRGETELALSSRELALLEYLLRHAGQVVTRTMIMEHVWDLAYDPVSNVVDQYVAYLRRKIDRPFGVVQLETVRGAGYRLLAGPRPEG